MAERRPKGGARDSEVPWTNLAEKLAAHVADKNGWTQLRALANLRTGIEQAIRAEVLLAVAVEGRTWQQIGEELGVSAQAAHRRYSGRAPVSRG
jgi:hypothetical protein